MTPRAGWTFAGTGTSPRRLSVAEREEMAAQHARWLAWAQPEKPSSMRDEPELAKLRERWPLDGGGEGPLDVAAAGWPPVESERAKR